MIQQHTNIIVSLCFGLHLHIGDECIDFSNKSNNNGNNVTIVVIMTMHTLQNIGQTMRNERARTNGRIQKLIMEKKNIGKQKNAMHSIAYDSDNGYQCGEKIIDKTSQKKQKKKKLQKQRSSNNNDHN